MAISAGYVVQLVVNGLVAGTSYALVAGGFGIIYATNRFIHLAHGGAVVATAYCLYALHAVAGLPYLPSAALSLVFAAALGLGMSEGFFAPFRRRGASRQVLLVAGLALLMLVENAVLLVFGPDVKSYGVRLDGPGLRLAGAIVGRFQVVQLGVALASLAALAAYAGRTRAGLELRAVASEPLLAETAGVDPAAARRRSFVVGTVLAGLAGILIGTEQNIEFGMGSSYAVKGFAGAVIGGVGSVPGAVAGGLLLGLAENLSPLVVPTAWREAVAYGLLVAFLLVRPGGIAGARGGDEP